VFCPAFARAHWKQTMGAMSNINRP